MKHCRTRTNPHLSRLLCLLAVAGLLGLAPAAGAAKERADYRNTVEWARLVVLWHDLLDHSSGAIYSPERFKTLAMPLARADASLSALAAKGLLPRPAAASLRWIYHVRYDDLRVRTYGVGRTGRADEMESAESASQWVVEMQLELLRSQSRAGRLERKLAEAIRANLVTELTFQHQMAALQGDLAAHAPGDPTDRDTLKEQKARARYAQDATKRRQQLLTTYQRRKLARDRDVEAAIPYVLELTKARPQ